ncbi:MAG: hypothetical protein PVI90_01885 [Desulfobacteraceae bacterium]
MYERGWLGLTVIMNLRSHRIVGWAKRDNIRVGLTLDALGMAYFQPKPVAGHPPDRVSQYITKTNSNFTR